MSYGEVNPAKENCAWCQEAEGAASFAGRQFGWCMYQKRTGLINLANNQVGDLIKQPQLLRILISLKINYSR
ncbi:hypothetical protein KY385_03185 [Candidatus Parcubacteria bacterium]|nr:hypothetical protein [Candidatus Parcubacteria bacterium]